MHVSKYNYKEARDDAQELMEKITFNILMPHICILDLQTPKSV